MDGLIALLLSFSSFKVQLYFIFLLLPDDFYLISYEFSFFEPFKYKDYKTCNFHREMTLDADEFIKRFLHHILPCGFYKIRYFGLLAPCNAHSKLETCFSLIENNSFLPQFEGLPAFDVWQLLTGKNPFCCPVCGKGKMIQTIVWPDKREQSG